MANPQGKVETDHQYVDLGGQDCTRTSITGLKRHDYVVSSRGPFTGILDDSPQQPGSDDDCSVFIWMEMRYILIRRLLTADTAKSRPAGDMVWTDGLGSGPQRLALTVLKELVTLGVLLSENSCLPCTAATMLRKAPEINRINAVMTAKNIDFRLCDTHAEVLAQPLLHVDEPASSTSC